MEPLQWNFALKIFFRFAFIRAPCPEEIAVLDCQPSFFCSKIRGANAKIASAMFAGVAHGMAAYRL